MDMPPTGKMPKVNTDYQKPLPGEVVWDPKEKEWRSTNAYWERMIEYEKAHGITPEMLSGGVTWPTPGARDGKDKDARNRGGGKASAKPFVGDAPSAGLPDRTREAVEEQKTVSESERPSGS